MFTFAVCCHGWLFLLNLFTFPCADTSWWRVLLLILLSNEVSQYDIPVCFTCMFQSFFNACQNVKTIFQSRGQNKESCSYELTKTTVTFVPLILSLSPCHGIFVPVLGGHLLIQFLFWTGGSLTKIAYYSTISHRRVLYGNESEEANSNSEVVSSSFDKLC